jgi:hypothetical protein
MLLENTDNNEVYRHRLFSNRKSCWEFAGIKINLQNGTKFPT